MKIVPYKGYRHPAEPTSWTSLIYERIAVKPGPAGLCAPTPEHRALIRQRAAAYDEWPRPKRWTSTVSEADTRLHGTWFSAMGKMYLWRTLQNAHADYSRFRMLDTLTTGGLAGWWPTITTSSTPSSGATSRPLSRWWNATFTAASAVWAQAHRGTPIILNDVPWEQKSASAQMCRGAAVFLSPSCRR
ncbi:MAG: hypothetical protein ACLT5P_06670 [Flavonifractor plautii]